LREDENRSTVIVVDDVADKEGRHGQLKAMSEKMVLMLSSDLVDFE